MASILPFIRDASSFDHEALSAMGAAFDRACRVINDSGSDREHLASCIVQHARAGVRDADLLCEAALKSFSAQPRKA